MKERDKSGFVRPVIMSKEFEYIKECGCFYVLTINGDFPAGRPFGAIMEDKGFLYISTHDGNKVHKQLRQNGNIQILAKKDGTREWLRLTGTADECVDVELKQKMMHECPNLSKHFSSEYDEHFLLFRISIKDTEWK